MPTLRSTAVWRCAASALFWVVLTVAASQSLSAKEQAPKVTEDGLELKKQTKQRLVYVRPGATLPQYDHAAILDPYIEFSKDWLRDYNNSQRDPSAKIKDEDLERAKQGLTEEFRKIFSEELTKGGYQVVDADAAGPETLVLRPALINIQVSAPDLMTPGRSYVFAESSGQMTLYLELWDGKTNTILARVMDAESDPGFGGQRQTSTSNRAAAERILSSWAVELRKKLDLAREKSAEQ